MTEHSYILLDVERIKNAISFYLEDNERIGIKGCGIKRFIFEVNKGIPEGKRKMNYSTLNFIMSRKIKRQPEYISDQINNVFKRIGL